MLEGTGALVALAAIAFLGSVVYGIGGFGSALVTIPLASHIVPLPFALAVFALMDLGNALRLGLQRPADASKADLLRMVPMMLVGTALGITVLFRLPRAGAMLALGVFVLLYAGYSLVRRPGGAIIDTHWAYVAGFAGGITSTLFGAGGPPYAIYLAHRPLTKEQFRATLTLGTLFSISTRVIVFTLSGLLLKREVWLAAAAVLPAAYVGISLGSRLFGRVSHELLLRLISLLLLASGGSLIARALV